ncbi:selenium-dependent molybdenum cofactor biosynthesis protein YqeB [uncultured Sphaerochaeta sp.]|uniref:selenium-dependent molybdenum cofactor biosynthesis protein YqeB n=1 Tax=uncultured Sphaerochaeta sp. TaxID=886478 RepID=UPI002A0A5FC6|nr:selenium-dependent molybdenum cofactor biosynthesis protein YqeB [uncultured Sphaerochaeta sp.]
MKHTVFEAAAYLSEHKEDFVYATIIRTEGSTSRNQGSMVIDTKGRITGTVGGGELEAYVLSQSLNLISNDESYRHIHFTVQMDDEVSVGVVYLFLLRCTSDVERKAFIDFRRWESYELDHVFGLQLQPTVALLGLCEGGATIGDVHPTFLSHAQEALNKKSTTLIDTGSWTCHLSLPVNYHNLLLIGGGHVNQAIAELAHFVGIPTQVVETREDFATEELFTYSKKREVAPTLAEALNNIETNEYTACIIASHAFGPGTTKLLLGRNIAYLGVLGSRHKAKKLLASLTLDQNDLKRLHCPIGLDIGTETPQEIALSVLSEVMKVFNNRSGQSLKHKANKMIVVRGGGDLATGVILRLFRAGYYVVVLETEQPTVIRRTVSIAQAMYSNTDTIEGVIASRCNDLKDAYAKMDAGIIPVLADPEGEQIKRIKPVCVVDAIMAKKNIGTTITDAPLVIALGPGFVAKQDCDLVIETMRGHSLARILSEGSAMPNTGIPGVIGGYGKERVLHSPAEGVFSSDHQIGDLVKQGEVIAKVGEVDVIATIDGKLRGLLNNGLKVPEHFKIADIDPRGEYADHTTVSEKAMAIGGAVLEAVDGFLSRA